MAHEIVLLPTPVCAHKEQTSYWHDNEQCGDFYCVVQECKTCNTFVTECEITNLFVEEN